METFEEVAKERGWSPEEQVEILLEYIENQESDGAFMDFILEHE